MDRLTIKLKGIREENDFLLKSENIFKKMTSEKFSNLTRLKKQTK